MNATDISTGPVREPEQTFTGMRAVVLGATSELASAFASQRMENDLPIDVEIEPDGETERLPAALSGAQIAILAQGTLPIDIATQCSGLLHVIFLSGEPQNHADLKALENMGITPHTLSDPQPSTATGLADAAIEQCRRIVSPTGG
ncbi:MAG: hypothetical protein EOO28_18755 [Comamonadaceae bacterium]|nr:MAG: hypothetical protein EOO28_18755 [Comamonadaceae bacterium]